MQVDRKNTARNLAWNSDIRQDEEFRKKYNDILVALREDPRLGADFALLDPVYVWDIMAEDLARFTFTTVTVKFCKCGVISSEKPTRRTSLPMPKQGHFDAFDLDDDDERDEEEELGWSWFPKAVGEIAETFFATHHAGEGRCQICNTILCVREQLLDRLPIYLMIAFHDYKYPYSPRNLPSRITEKLNFGYHDSQGATLTSKFTDVRALLLGNEWDLYQACIIKGGLARNGWIKDSRLFSPYQVVRDTDGYCTDREMMVSGVMLVRDPDIEDGELGFEV